MLGKSEENTTDIKYPKNANNQGNQHRDMDNNKIEKKKIRIFRDKKTKDRESLLMDAVSL